MRHFVEKILKRYNRAAGFQHQLKFSSAHNKMAGTGTLTTQEGHFKLAKYPTFGTFRAF